jgi:hypothetical protein
MKLEKRWKSKNIFVIAIYLILAYFQDNYERGGCNMRSMIFVALVAVFLSPIVFAQEKWEAPVWKVGDKWVFKMANGQIQNNEVVEIEKDVYIKNWRKILPWI